MSVDTKQNEGGQKKQSARTSSARTSSGQVHSGHRERMRQRFVKEGLAGTPPHNVLEFLLFYALRQGDTNELAHRLIDRFGGLAEVLNAPYDELKEVNGVSDSTAAFLSLLPQVFIAYNDDLMAHKKVTGRADIEKYIFTMLCGETREKVMIACLDNRAALIKAEIVGEGSVNFSAVDNRAIVSAALRHNATAAIIAHNHPRGFALPSREDILVTSRVKDALDTIGVQLIDHIIVAPDDYISLAKSERFCDIF